METIYLDHNATTKPTDEVVAAMHDALTKYWANASSIHRPGIAVKQQLELARESVCRLINCSERELVFTSGGTEGANLAIGGSLAAQPKKNVLVTSRLEHNAVREYARVMRMRGVDVVWLANDNNGIVDLSELKTILDERADDIAIVSIMWANNETGVVQPIESIGALCREHGVRFHVDGTQWVGKMPVDVQADGGAPFDLLSFAAHKFYGPKGAGALWIKRGVRITKQIIGGPHEGERRGGTENIPCIVGMGAAAKIAKEWLADADIEERAACRDRFQKKILNAFDDEADRPVINGGGATRIWNTTNIAFPRLEAEAILLNLSERGVCASAGSACSSGSLDPSPVIQAMHVPPELGHGSVRFSIGRKTGDDDLSRAADIIVEVVNNMRSAVTVA